MLISQPNLNGFAFCTKKHLNASVLPQFLGTQLTSSFNFRKVQIWPRTFPLCNAFKSFTNTDKRPIDILFEDLL